MGLRSVTSFVFALSACAPPETKITKLTPDVTVAPGEVLFGDVVPSLEVERSIQVVNAGRTVLEVSDIYIDEADIAFELEVDPTLDELGEPMAQWEIGPGDSIPVLIRFTPEDLSSYSTTLTILSNDEDTPTLEVPVTGTGVIGPQPDIALSVEAIDFGTVSTGDTQTEYLLVQNVGDGPLQMIQTDQVGSGAFSVVTDPVGQTIPAASAATVLIEYTPNGGIPGHSGTITFMSNDPDQPEVSVELVGGDGGPDADYPEAMIEAVTEINPPSLVTFDGTGSTAAATADDDDLTYEWSIVNGPVQSNAELIGDTLATAQIDVDVAGTYTVQLTVTGTDGLRSAPAQHSVLARPVEELYIALTWDKGNADLDLHVVPSGGIFWSSDDLSFCSTEVDWGEDGSGTHSGDDDDGFGPETVAISVEETGYHIAVHYFEDNGGSEVEATLTVYLNGEPHETITTTLVHNYFWRAGYISIEDGEGLFVPSSDSPYFSSTRECSE
jgi:hypothetical protein